MKFTTPVSMPITEAQYNELKPLLEAMGYKGFFSFEDGFTYIATGTNENSELFVCCHKDAIHAYNRTFIPTYNKDLFLAIAAMTDEPNGIAGEWWKCLDTDDPDFYKDKIYKSAKPINNLRAIIASDGTSIGYGTRNHDHFTKATVSEIFAHFGVSYGKEQAEPIQPEIPQPTPFQGIDRRTYLAGCIVSGIFSAGLYFDAKEIVESVNKLIQELDKTK